MQIISFEPNALGIEWLDATILVVILADNAQEPIHYLELQRSFEQPDEFDQALEMDSYCLTTANGATTYGGITLVQLDQQQCLI